LTTEHTEYTEMRDIREGMQELDVLVPEKMN